MIQYVMVDRVSKKVRSRIMSQIHGKNTGPEKIMREYLKNRRFKFSAHHRIAGYRVDFALPRRRVAVFVDGCFWHACPKCFRQPKSNKAYWKKKISQNVKRDRRIDKEIRSSGWKTVHFWEHSLKKRPANCQFKLPKHL